MKTVQGQKPSTSRRSENLLLLRPSRAFGGSTSTSIDHLVCSRARRFSSSRVVFILFGKTCRMWAADERRSALRRSTRIRFGRIWYCRILERRMMRPTRSAGYKWQSNPMKWCSLCGWRRCTRKTSPNWRIGSGRHLGSQTRSKLTTKSIPRLTSKTKTSSWRSNWSTSKRELNDNLDFINSPKIICNNILVIKYD